MTAPPAVPESFRARLAELVSKFDRHRDQYLKASYNESQVRVDFVDPLFEALGWDVRNAAGLGPREREVVVERGETAGRPDYNFRLEGQTKFFVEAKAPHVPLDRSDVIMQAKSYAWNTRDVFVAAVSDFEEFRLYDASLKPDRKRPDTGLLFALRYGDYLTPDGLARLWELSREAVRAGSLDRLLKVTAKEKRQRVPVDQAFLADLTGWRERLAKAVYKAHPGMEAADLNSAVQVFLDRLIFIRIAEDRGVLPPRGLKEIVEAWEYSGKCRPLADDLNALFREVNDRLNGEIFKPHHSEKIARDAPLVAGIAAGLYYPACPYRFDVIGVELLGSIYERYLGKTIRVTEKRAIVEDKPEVRKAGGVYYTPKPDPHPQPLSLKGRGESAPSPSPRRGVGRGEGRQLSLLPPADLTHLRPFNWESEREGFGAIMKAGGFDAVIGNPPWGGDIDKITRYIEEHYPDSTQGYRDTSKLFIDKGLRLVRNKGLFSMIVPSAFMFQPRYVDVRRLLRRYAIVNLWNVGDKVFSPKVTAPCCVFVVKKETSGRETAVLVLDTSYTPDNAERARVAQAPSYRSIPQSVYEKTTEETFVTYYRELGPKEVPLEKVLDCRDCGIKHQRVGVGMEQKGKSDLAARLYYEGRRQSARDHKYLIGADLSADGWFMDYSHERYFRNNYEKILRANEIVYFNEEIFDLPQKIVWRQTSDRIRATIIGPHWFANTLQAGILLDERYDLRYVLGLLNSRFINFVYLETVKEGGRVFPQVKMGKVRALPLRTIDFSDPADKARHDRMVALVERMLELHKRKAEAKSETLRAQLEREINVTDEQIDGLVYELYGLTEEEVRLVEGK